MLTSDIAIDIGLDALRLVIVIVLVLIVPSLVMGLVVALFQAATQINEQTLSFLPRLIVTLITLGLAAPWLAGMLTDFAAETFARAATLAG
ncbi:flagellar biosynthetic protein FliQ [Pandoraea apista]|uniref:Flagellar biosynthesis protein FliQ n=1 Tax=Pandoraea apista TaxID=93218 RepID=A0A0G4JHF1_9BURK|nr:flagellar biosynthetic protein FliQ [Pandoraea apista]ALS65387.1 flagellar biosynthetic protein FliQ [Pandoraea apista]AVF39760.1 flagellar type III secretion system protein FliQ [Pandoraea apista]OXS94157.1 flagellar biosynthetic protein FliQ [Pandoraea apista]PTE01145.1 flagellar biosynthetic protein FliQ [Pandoraea apista]RRJ33947.1 flagellar biosynthetic protein FliQ [Pandoraea apista]